MSTEGRLDVAASRAQYFSDLYDSQKSAEKTSPPRKPSYVGLSHSLNGYTAYAPYQSALRRSSPPIGGGVASPPTCTSPPLVSVPLVLTQDGFQRSLNDFNNTMRDLCIDMGRPRNGGDMTDNAAPSIISKQEGYYPKSQTKKVINDGNTQCTEILTVFHRNGAENGSGPSATKNLVSKQIERLYGDATLAQLRLTSPEPPSPNNGYSNGGSYNGAGCGYSDENGSTPLSSRTSEGGFFAKRFGIVKMKDHNTAGRRSLDAGLNGGNSIPAAGSLSAEQLRPMKVPAVFRLLRPEFREQLKQSSCKVPQPGEEGKERIIPIRLDAKPNFNSSPQQLNNHNNSPSTANKERIIPIVRETSTTPNNSQQQSNIRPSPSSIVPTVVGFNRFFGPGKAGSPSTAGTPVTRGEPHRNGGDSGGKSLIVRKLSPLSPKHIVIQSASSPNNNNNNNSNGRASAKPAPPVKPDHLKSPPMSPVPPSEDLLPAVARSYSPPSSGLTSPKGTPRAAATSFQTPPTRNLLLVSGSSSSGVLSSDKVLEQNRKFEAAAAELKTESDTDVVVGTNVQEQVEDQQPQLNETVDTLKLSEHLEDERLLTSDTFESREPDVIDDARLPSTDEVALPAKLNTVEPIRKISSEGREVEIMPDEQENQEFGPYEGEDEYEIDLNGTGYQTEYYQGGLRERELLCPIMEEDNESSASGSLSNLHTNNNGSSYAPDDPLLFTEQGELQDGHYFIKVLENEIFKFEEQICDFEEELSSSCLPEEAREGILATVGQAKLLMAQKLAQFRGLCDKNIKVTREEDPFVPTCQDLAGFWDMVHIQVEQVHNKFADLQKLRSRDWKPEVIEKKKPAPSSKAKKNISINKPIRSAEKSEAAKARDEARRKMMEDRKRHMKEKKQQVANNGGSDLIIIM